MMSQDETSGLRNGKQRPASSGSSALNLTTKPGTGNPLHTQEPVTVASFRTWRGWREYVAWDRCLTSFILAFAIFWVPQPAATNVTFGARNLDLGLPFSGSFANN